MQAGSKDKLPQSTNYSLQKFEKDTKTIASKTSSINDLIEVLQKHINWQVASFGSINLERSQPLLELYEGTDRKGKATFSESSYTRYAVKMPSYIKEFDIYIIGWNSNQMSKIHNHASNGCIMKFVQGTIHEKRYNKDSKGFNLQEEIIYNAGQTAFIRDDVGYHAIGTQSDQPAVSIHVYSPAKHITTFFDT